MPLQVPSAPPALPLATAWAQLSALEDLCQANLSVLGIRYGSVSLVCSCAVRK